MRCWSCREIRYASSAEAPIDQRDDAEVKAHARVDGAQVRAHEQRAHAPLAFHHRLEADEMGTLEAERRAACPAAAGTSLPGVPFG